MSFFFKPFFKYSYIPIFYFIKFLVKIINRDWTFTVDFSERVDDSPISQGSMTQIEYCARSPSMAVM